MFAKFKYLLQISLLLLITSCAAESSTQLTNINSDELSVVKEVTEFTNTATPSLPTTKPSLPTTKPSLPTPQPKATDSTQPKVTEKIKTPDQEKTKDQDNIKPSQSGNLIQNVYQIQTTLSIRG